MFIKRDKKNDCLIAGYVVGDQKEKDFNGKPYIEFGIGMGKDEQGENLPIVNITVWDRSIPTIRKGDRVLAAGKLKITEKEDKTYYSLTADFCIKEILNLSTAESIKEYDSTLAPVDDDDLPF